MDARQTVLGSPWRLLGGAVVVVLLFALLYPFSGFSSATNNVSILYDWRIVSDSPGLFWTVFLRSLAISVGMFTLVGAPEFMLVGFARYLAGLESLLGMVFVALLAASLLQE